MSLNSYINSEWLVSGGLQPGHLTQTPAEKIIVITVDGRTLTGSLVSCDQVTNLVLVDTTERTIRSVDEEEASREERHGLYLIRGDNVVCVGLVEEELDASIDWTRVRGEVIRSTKNI